MRAVVALIAVAGLMSACGDSGEQADGGPGGDAADAPRDTGTPDVPHVDGGGDTNPVTCTVPASYGDVGAPANAQAISDQFGILWAAPLDSNRLPDFVTVELYPGFGVFTGGPITTGTWDLGSMPVELQYATCGVCVRLLGDVDTSTGNETQAFMITGGTLAITSITGTLVGMLTNATFEHVTIDRTTYESTPVGDGCGTAITNMSVNTPLR